MVWSQSGTQFNYIIKTQSYNKMEATTLRARLQSQLYTNWARVIAFWRIYKIVLNVLCPKGQCDNGHYTLVFN